MEEFPKPSRILIIASVAVISLAMCILGVGLSGVIAAPNPLVFFGGIIVIPLAGAVALLQYRGTFRSDASAASTMSLLFCFASGLMAFAGVLGMAEWVWQGTRFGVQEWSISAGFLALTGTLVAVGRLNYTWSRHAWLALAAEVVPGRRGISLREFLGLTAAVALVAGVTTYAIKDHRVRMNVNVTASATPMQLPLDAQDVSYAYIPGELMACEFTASEKAFRTWIKLSHENSSSTPANHGPNEIVRVSFPRYVSLTRPRSREVQISDGLSASWVEPYRFVHVAYDRETGRGYYYSESR